MTMYVFKFTVLPYGTFADIFQGLYKTYLVIVKVVGVPL